MATIRLAKRKRYTSIAREALNDERLSFRARGVLAWLLDKPDDWTVDSEQIARAATEGRDAVRTALRELEAAGYLRREKVRNMRGQLATVTTVYEGTQPTPAPENPAPAGPASVDQRPANQPTDDRAPDSQAPIERLLPSTVTDDGDAKTGTEQPCPASPSEPKPRPRDVLWEAVLGVSGIALDADLTASERGRFNAAVKQLRDVGASPAEVSRRARIYRLTWPKVSLTPTALAANWSSVAADVPQAARPRVPKAWESIRRHREAREAQEAGAAS